MNESDSLPCAVTGTPQDAEILRSLMEVIPDRIYFKDLESRFVRVNQAYVAWHGIATPEEVIGKTDADLFAPVHADVARLHRDERRLLLGECAVDFDRREARCRARRSVQFGRRHQTSSLQSSC